ncbi:hypothetical protein HMPREF3227_01353 [Corynebacterium sp. CMW7794]|nr:hypothetical protein HMPREF3227_01353 [Corynebacterium sp. CMW7794]
MGGSSPLTRGALNPRANACIIGRLIPAHAGSTHRTPLRRCGRWAHPRSRGEHGEVASLRVLAEGSSPLTRGAP